MKKLIVLMFCMVACHATQAQPGRRQFRRQMAYATDTIGVHDPVMAYERGTYYLLATGNGLQWATSTDRKTWVVQPTPFIENIPQWTVDSVPGFRSHVWAPDVIQWHNRWWLAYSCSTFGKNTSAIGLMSADRMNECLPPATLRACCTVSTASACETGCAASASALAASHCSP